MTLNSSGPISLGGSTTGQSINLELGFSATALADINSTSFRTLAGVASGAISLNNFYGKSNTSAFWVLISNTSGATTLYLGGQYVTSNGSFIVNQAQDSSSTNSMNIYKISGNGSLISSSKLIGASDTPVGTGNNFNSALVVDSSCNIYTIRGGILTKTNPTASSYSAFTYSLCGFDSIVFDGTYLYSPVYYNTCCTCFPGWAKYNTSLTPSGVKASANYAFNINSIAYDGGTGLYQGHGQGYISKFDTSFNFLWCWNLPGGYGANAIGANSTNSTIAISNYYSGSSTSYISMSSVASANSTTKPTLNYSYTLGSGGSQYPSVVSYSANCIDSSNNAYHLVGITNNPYGYVLIKINSSGTVQWQRSFRIYYSGGSAPFQNFRRPFISVDNNFVRFSGFIVNGSPNAIFYIQYPTDGSKTGTYGLINNCQLVISASSITLTSNSLTWGGSANFTIQTPTNTSSSYSSGSSGSATDSFFHTTL